MELLDFRDAIFDSMFSLMQEDQRALLITNDMGALGLAKLRELDVRRVVNGGVAEQNIMGVAAGLGMDGRRVFVFGISAHLISRAYEQVKLDIAALQKPVILLAMGGGLSYGGDGPTHHALQDISLLRSIPGIHVFEPSDPPLAKRLIQHAFKRSLPAYIRLDKEPTRYISSSYFLDEGIGVANSGEKMAIISSGILVHRLRSILKDLPFSPLLLDCFRPNPFPEEVLTEKTKNCSFILSVEEHSRTGGLASALADWKAKTNSPIKLEAIALKDAFYFGSSTRKYVHGQEGMDEESIKRKITEILKKVDGKI